nr:MAG TPA: hypothetical protein [Caudoviricetes sp.]
MIGPMWGFPACTRCAGCGCPITLTWTSSCEGHDIDRPDVGFPGLHPVCGLRVPDHPHVDFLM